MREFNTPLEIQEEQAHHSFIDGPYIFIKDNFIENYTIKGSLDVHKYGIENERIPIIPGERFIFHCFIDNRALSGPTESFSFEIQLADDYIEDVCDYKEPERLLAISDIEGNFHGLRNILVASEVMDNQCNWIFKNGHIVVTGDLIDRGVNVMACLWLIYKLDMQAKSAGGKVHYLLGNHEIMNFSGDFRYVNQKYKNYQQAVNWSFYNVLGNDSLIARWQREKNSVEKIGKYLFLHAGFSKEVLHHEFSLNQINTLIRENLHKPFEELKSESHRLLFDDLGPLWYRGLIDKNKKYHAASAEDVEDTVKHFKVKKIVVGHTLVPFIQKFHNDQVIAIDTNMPGPKNHSRVQALLIDKGKEFVFDEKGNNWKL